MTSPYDLYYVEVSASAARSIMADNSISTRAIAIDDAVIEGAGQVHHLSHGDEAAVDYRTINQFIRAYDRNFWMIDHGRRHNPAECAEARDGYGRAG